MPKCVVKNCKNYTLKAQKKDGVSYFHFPQNQIQREKWRCIIAQDRAEEFYKPNASSVVCSDHFCENDMYITKKGFRRIKKTAIPTMQLTESRTEEDKTEILQSPCASQCPLNLNIELKNTTTIPNKQTDESMVKNNRELEPPVLEPTGLEMNQFQINTVPIANSPCTSLSIGSALDTPKRATLRKDLRLCKRRLLDKSNKIKNLQKINKRLKKKNATLKSLIMILRKQKDLDESVLDNLSSRIEVKDTFNALFLKNIKKRKRPFSKYPPGARKFALTVHFYSPAAYRYIRKMFHNCLPHPNTLFNWYRSMDAKPGFTAETLDRLKQKSQSTNKEILCALVADEMSIRQQKIWCGGRYIGVVDMGLGEVNDNDPIAQQAYVLLLVSLSESWKIPLAYFFITGLKAEMKANIIHIALQKCHSVGVKVVSLTFDGCKSNLLTMKLLGCKIDDIHNLKTFFEHPVSKHMVTVFLDACHMVKLMRNTLESKQCITDDENKIIKWKLLCQLNNLQQKLCLNLANKLTNRHIEFKNEIMKVKLATQLMSRSVAKAIQFCQDLNIPEFRNSDPTIKYLLLLNDLFDVLNSRNLKDPGFKKPLQPRNVTQCFAFLQGAKKYLTSLSITIRRKKTIRKKSDTRVVFTTEIVPLWKCQSNTGVVGLLVCIESIQHLYRNIVESQYLSFLLAYKVSQDHIELFFGNIRSHGGHNNNPNVQQFMAAYKKILTFIETRDKFTGNCIPLEEMPILNSGNAIKSINNTSVGYRLELELEGDVSREKQKCDIDQAEVEKYQDNCDILSTTLNEQSTEHESELIVQIIGYVSGFVVRHLLKRIKCEYCKDCLLAKEKLRFHKLIDIKDLGGLCYASEDVYLICEKTEDIVRRFLRTGGCTKEKMCIAAYRYIRKMFHNCLPHPNTLFNWYRSMDAKPGFTAETLDRLKQKSQSTNKEILCALVADEMSIRQQKIWCGGRYIGVVDMGLGEVNDNDPIAQQAYVLLLVSLSESWKIPLAYFFITGLKAEMKANIIHIALQKCHSVGVKVVSLTFDGCKSNLLTMKLLGCKIDDIHNLKTFFEHPVSKHMVTVFLDACHMVKLMRNTLESKQCITDDENKIIKWKLLCQLNNLQQKLCLNLANKLTNRHIEFKNEIMKVKLATQLMSRSVAKAIQFCQDLNIPEFRNSDPTIKYLLLLNDLFDVLNSRNLKDPGFKKPLQPRNVTQCFAFLQGAKKYLTSLSITIRRKKTIRKKSDTRVVFTTEIVPLWKCQSNTGVVGLLVCIESIQHLYRNIVESQYLSFLLAYKVSQDHIELFFGNIRSHGGHNNNPNVQQFMAAYKKILTFIETRDKFTGNCIPLEEMPILNSGNAIKSINNTSVGYRLELELEGDVSREKQKCDIDQAEVEKYQDNCDILSTTLNEQSTEHESELIVQIIGYVSGFVVRHLLKRIKCEYCKDCLLAKEKLRFHKLIDIKDLGGLCYASEDVYLICEKTEDIVRRFLRTGGCTKEKMCISVLKQFINCKVFRDINEHCQGMNFGHKVELLKAVIDKYIDIRLHYAGKLKTAEIKNKSKRQLYNKLNLFQGT